MAKIKKILVANRGEIALRVIRTAHEMGISTVAVYSDADRAMPHVQFADEALHIGAATSSESYLSINNIIEAAKKTGADSIHPGYGFLAENAEFAEQTLKAGLEFIGPSADTIRMMGNKLSAKKAVSTYKIPMVPGADKAVKEVAKAEKMAAGIGFPVLIKAAAGGGGKGMRVVKKSREFKEQMQLAQSEAEAAFGDGSVFIEKYVQSPRHIEIQILGDKKGNMVHLFERECSIQRRHQKVVEEAPSSVLSAELRAQMGAMAIDVAKSCNYVGAGTVEFLLDENMNFYFLEMNTRLQVEHPVTEMITGLDLVAEQIKIAEGKPLAFKQDDLSIFGHAIQLRVYAEDPSNGFLPDVGRLNDYIRPAGPGVRVDDGYENGMEIPIFYDPLISKLITFGESREHARKRMLRAISEYSIGGVLNTLPFGRFVMNHPDFIKGNYNTNFVAQHYKPTMEHKKNESQIAAILGTKILESQKSDGMNTASMKSMSKWRQRRVED